MKFFFPNVARSSVRFIKVVGKSVKTALRLAVVESLLPKRTFQVGPPSWESCIIHQTSHTSVKYICRNGKENHLTLHKLDYSYIYTSMLEEERNRKKRRRKNNKYDR